MRTPSKQFLPLLKFVCNGGFHCNLHWMWLCKTIMALLCEDISLGSPKECSPFDTRNTEGERSLYSHLSTCTIGCKCRHQQSWCLFRRYRIQYESLLHVEKEQNEFIEDFGIKWITDSNTEHGIYCILHPSCNFIFGQHLPIYVVHNFVYIWTFVCVCMCVCVMSFPE